MSVLYSCYVCANLTTTDANANVCLFYSETAESLLVIKGPQGRINRAIWGPLNKTIISAGEDAVIRIWDSEVRSCFLLPIFVYFVDTHTRSM